ncbi:MAG TPA: RluA family pseudouridine synthase [Vicinamibacteria bacterium]|nr:RluA family pseudouridine synthase [Vicinamibacteria bacterium]
MAIGVAEAGRRLEELVADRVSGRLGRPLPRSAARRLVMGGAVRLRGRPLRRPGVPVAAGWSLELLVDRSRLSPRRPDVAFALAPRDVLYHDAALIAVAKPAGLATVPTADASRSSLFGAVRAWLVGRGEGAYLAVHQRLDRETSGVVLFAHDARANAALADAFAAGRVEKTYVALTARPERPPAERFRVDSPIEGRRAVTDVVLRRRLASALLVEAHPSTGRKHQVRIHLRRAGLPILGDERHGGRAGPRAPRLMLHAARLELDHPISGERLRIACSAPRDFEAFAAALVSSAGRSGPR